jgi:hypothetical protein
MSTDALALIFLAAGTPPDPATRTKRVETLEEKKQRFVTYYDAQIENIRAFFKDENFTVAAAAFEYLLDLKKNKMRKNNYIPDHAHEIDQILPLMTCLQSGSLKNDRAAIEEKYGSIEKWFLGKIVHDIGEDFNVFPQELIDELRRRVSISQNCAAEEEENLIQRTARSMERLTHYRKFTVEQIEALTGVSLSDLRIRPGQIVPLDKDVADILWDKMNILKYGRENLQLYAKWDDKKQQPQIILTRYGKSDLDTPENEKQYGPEWTLYIHKLLTSGHEKGDGENDFYDALVKMADRVNGLATRIAISGDTMDSYDNYLRETSLLFSIYGAANMMIKHLYEGTPLERYIHSEDLMMGLLLSIGGIYSQHHPTKEKNGEKGESLWNMIKIAEDGVNPLKFSIFFPSCEHNYAHVSQISHPIALIFRDLRAASHKLFSEVHKKFYKLLVGAIVENEKDGANLAYIISGRPEDKHCEQPAPANDDLRPA